MSQVLLLEPSGCSCTETAAVCREKTPPRFLQPASPLTFELRSIRAFIHVFQKERKMDVSVDRRRSSHKRNLLCRIYTDCQCFTACWTTDKYTTSASCHLLLVQNLTESKIYLGSVDKCTLFFRYISDILLKLGFDIRICSNTCESSAATIIYKKS